MTRSPAADTATQALPLKLFRGVAERRYAARLREQLAVVERQLLAQLDFASAVADAPARYLAEAGGKRIRPMLTLLTSELGSGPNELVRTAAVAVELTHLASLYHDDVMDDAGLRRGVPAAHTVWANSVAILAGDLLFARASTLVSGMGEEAIILQARAFERLCLGQLHETVGPGPQDNPREYYLRVLADKTGALIATAARMGVLFSDAPHGYADAVANYGEKLGVAFQLIDDVIDLSPSTEHTGKRSGTDLRAGVLTMPILLLRERAATGDRAAAALCARIDEGVAQAAEPRHASDGESELTHTAPLDAAVTALQQHEVTRETTQIAKHWAVGAVRALDPLPDSAVRRGLERLADSMITRQG